MNINSQTDYAHANTRKWGLIAGLIFAAVALGVLSAALPSNASNSRGEPFSISTTTATPVAPGLAEFAASFTIGDIGQFAQSPAAAAQAVGLDDTVVILDEGFEGAWSRSPDADCPSGVSCISTSIGYPRQELSGDDRLSPKGVLAPTAAVASIPQATGGPDDFGYLWDDAVPFNWIDATIGTNTGIVGDDRAGLVEIGFPFKFYEQIWTQVYISTNGLLVFGQDTSGCCGRIPMPLPNAPNNVIASFWDHLTVGSPYNNGAIYTLSGGAAPNRYFVVQWRNVTQCCYVGATDFKTFQVVLHENGDTVAQYQSMAGSLGYASVGIEDSTGTDGLKYSSTPANSKAIRFYRPAPAARVKVWPLYQGRFTRAGALETFRVPICNTGELDVDTYDLSTNSPWPVSLYAADGLTPLADTDGDGVVDTGPVAQGSTLAVTVKVQTPLVAGVGDSNAASITARSSLNATCTKTTTLQTAVPAQFAQVYRDDADGAMSLYLAQPAGQITKKVTPDGHYGSSMAVAETPTGHFIYAWTKSRQVGNVKVGEIEYTMLDRLGNTVRTVSKLADHSGATVRTYDYPVVAVAPNGRIGVLWNRYLWNDSTSQFNDNIYFAVLDAAGNVVVSPMNLTNNTIWGTRDEYLVPSFDYPRIVATKDNRFVMGWVRSHEIIPGTMSYIYYAIHDTNGGTIKWATQFGGGSYGGRHLDLAALSGNRALLVLGFGDIFYAVLDSSGNIVKNPTNLEGASSSSWNTEPHAVQLPDGRIVVAWTAGKYPNYRIRYAVLDASYNRVAGPTTPDAPAALTSSYWVSVAADSSNRAILTWMDLSNRTNLYYALIGGNGGVLTPPMIFRTSQATSPYIVTSSEGYGNTSYSSMPPDGVDGVVAFDSPTFNGSPGGYARLSVRYTNYGATTATGVTLVADLGSNLTYIGDTSGATPVVSGTTVTWSLPDLALLEERAFTLAVGVPTDTASSTRYPVMLTFTSAGPEVNVGDNTASAEVVAVRQRFLPLVCQH